MPPSNNVNFVGKLLTAIGQRLSASAPQEQQPTDKAALQSAPPEPQALVLPADPMLAEKLVGALVLVFFGLMAVFLMTRPPQAPAR